MRIVSYHPEYKRDFIELNLAWISAMFVLEPKDTHDLHAVDAALERGGEIFFALDDDNSVMACCMIAPRSDDGEWEIEKFAARGLSTGTGAGTACLHACIDYAKVKGAPRIQIVTNTKCEAAIHLYRKNGFVQIPLNEQLQQYERANIAFELDLMGTENKE